MDSIPYSAVRANLAQTIKQLEMRDEPVYISRRGEPAAVLMSVAHYQRLQGGQGDFGQALLAWQERHATALAADNNDSWPDPFADVRDRSPDGGRPPLDWNDVLSADLEVSKPKPKPRRKPKTRSAAIE